MPVDSQTLPPTRLVQYFICKFGHRLKLTCHLRRSTRPVTDYYWKLTKWSKLAKWPNQCSHTLSPVNVRELIPSSLLDLLQRHCGHHRWQQAWWRRAQVGQRNLCRDRITAAADMGKGESLSGMGLCQLHHTLTFSSLPWPLIPLCCSQRELQKRADNIADTSHHVIVQAFVDTIQTSPAEKGPCHPLENTQGWGEAQRQQTGLWLRGELSGSLALPFAAD